MVGLSALEVFAPGEEAGQAPEGPVHCGQPQIRRDVEQRLAAEKRGGSQRLCRYALSFLSLTVCTTGDRPVETAEQRN